jgi:hypothetical protein
MATTEKCPNVTPAATKREDGTPLRDAICGECGRYLTILASGNFRRHARRLQPGDPRIAEALKERHGIEPVAPAEPVEPKLRDVCMTACFVMTEDAPIRELPHDRTDRQLHAARAKGAANWDAGERMHIWDCPESAPHGIPVGTDVTYWVDGVYQGPARVIRHDRNQCYRLRLEGMTYVTAMRHEVKHHAQTAYQTWRGEQIMTVATLEHALKLIREHDFVGLTTVAV